MILKDKIDMMYVSSTPATGNSVGRLKSHHIPLMVNGRNMAFLSNMETILQDGDEVLVFPPGFGG